MAAAVAWLIARFEMYCLADLARAGDWELQYLTRPAWAAVILLMIPVGGILYLLYGRPR